MTYHDKGSYESLPPCIANVHAQRRLVGSLKLYVSFAKEPYERDYILQKRPIIDTLYRQCSVLFHKCLSLHHSLCHALSLSHTHMYKHILTV